MTAHRLRRIASGALAAALTGLALASPHAPAESNDRPIDGAAPKPGELVSLAPDNVGSAKLTERERQYLASHGVGAPWPVNIGSSAAPPAPSSDSGLDWTAVAIGAGGAAVLIALMALGVPALGARRRLRTAP